MKKKTVAFFLCAAMAFASLSACSSPASSQSGVGFDSLQNENDIPEDDTSFKLSYTLTDSLDPFEAQTLNNQILAQLVFDGLFELDGSFKASAKTAESYRYSDKTELEVTLKKGIFFSNGKPLTADDVVYSFKKAADSAYWGNSLIGIASCSKEDENTVVFHLRYHNSYAHNLLIFPIVSSEGYENGYPVGSGRYRFDDDNGSTVLRVVKGNGFYPHLTTIRLENVISYESIDNAVNIGNISFAFRDLGSGSSMKLNCESKLVNMNNLVYLGVNGKEGVTANADIRKAISLAIDREELVKGPYNEYAYVAESVFNPKFELATAKIFSANADLIAAQQTVAKSPFSSPSLSLIVNAENTDRVNCAKMIKSQLEEAGFKVKLTEVSSYEKYTERIENENFDLYLGETRISPDMSLRSFLSSGGSTSYGIDFKSCEAAKQYKNYSDGQTDLGEFLLAFSEEMPYIPLLYRNGMICYSSDMKGDMQGTFTDCFANIEDWYFAS